MGKDGSGKSHSRDCHPYRRDNPTAPPCGGGNDHAQSIHAFHPASSSTSHLRAASSGSVPSTEEECVSFRARGLPARYLESARDLLLPVVERQVDDRRLVHGEVEAHDLDGTGLEVAGAGHPHIGDAPFEIG